MAQGHWHNRKQTVHVSTTAVGNVGVGVDDLITYSLPAGFLSSGRGVRITAWGLTANNVNAKTVILRFGNPILTTALTVSQAGVWRIVAEVISTGTAAQTYVAQLTQGGATTLIDVERGTLAEAQNAAIIIKCTGEATADNDIVQNGLVVEYI